MVIVGVFVVLFLFYLLLGFFVGVLMDWWDWWWVLVGVNIGWLVLIVGVGMIFVVGVGDVLLLVGVLVVNGLV